MSRDDQERLLAALQEKLNRARECPLLHYNPHDKQKRFHDAGKTYRRRMFLGSNRCGKTYAGSKEGVAHSLGYYFWKVPGLKLNAIGDLPTRNEIPREYWVLRTDGVPIEVPNRGVCVTGLNTRLGIGKVIWPALRDSLPRRWIEEKQIKVTWGSNSCPVQVVFPNGSEWVFYSREQDPITFEGVECHWAWGDEPIPSYAFNGIWRGLTQTYGSLWFTLTPLGANCRWIYFDMYKNPEVWKVEVALDDNPALSEASKREFMAELTGSEAEIRARTTGSFEFLGNAVFPEFKRDIHAIKPFAIPDHWIHGCTIDPHHRKAAFISWWAVDPETLGAGKPVFYFYREWPTRDYFSMEGGGLDFDGYSALIRNTEAARPSDIFLVDPRWGRSKFTVHGVETTNWVEEMATRGIYFDPRIHGIGRIEIGHARISQYLRYDPQYPISPTNTPQIFLFETCPNHIKGFENYGYLDIRDPEKGVIDDKVSQEFKEPIDCVRYTVLYNVHNPREAGENQGDFSEADLIEENQSWY